eukprot:7377669-Prymnesium_polylepis.2
MAVAGCGGVFRRQRRGAVAGGLDNGHMGMVTGSVETSTRVINVSLLDRKMLNFVWRAQASSVKPSRRKQGVRRPAPATRRDRDA